jgi:hypothetical protein
MNRRPVALSLLFILLLLIGYVAGCATASGQPHMQSALTHLQAARDELNRATTDKGGHRERAVTIIDEAIDQVQRGIEFARAH